MRDLWVTPVISVRRCRRTLLIFPDMGALNVAWCFSSFVSFAAGVPLGRNLRIIARTELLLWSLTSLSLSCTSVVSLLPIKKFLSSFPHPSSWWPRKDYCVCSLYKCKLGNKMPSCPFLEEILLLWLGCDLLPKGSCIGSLVLNVGILRGGGGILKRWDPMKTP